MTARIATAGTLIRGAAPIWPVRCKDRAHGPAVVLDGPPPGMEIGT